MQADLYAKPCKICQQFKKINTIYGNLTPKKLEELKSWDLVQVYLIGPYIHSIRQHQPGGAIIRNNDSLTCMYMIDSTTCYINIL